MLHDIGIVNVDAPSMGCTGDLPYLAHLSEGRRILEQAGLPRHALVAERHVGVGIPRADVLAHDLPLPPRDFVPQTTEEQIISWADLFFRKLPGQLWRELEIEEVRAQVVHLRPPRRARLCIVAGEILRLILFIIPLISCGRLPGRATRARRGPLWEDKKTPARTMGSQFIIHNFRRRQI